MTTPNSSDNDSDLELAVREAFSEIDAARAFVYAQELGPLTMLAALGSIEISVRHIRDEADLSEQISQHQREVYRRVEKQRDHLMHQRNALKIQLDEIRHDMQDDMIELRTALESRMNDAYKH